MISGMPLCIPPIAINNIKSWFFLFLLFVNDLHKEDLLFRLMRVHEQNFNQMFLRALFFR